MRAGPLVVLLLATLTAACGPVKQIGQIGYVPDFLGGVIADEPRAALVGRDVLSAGGSAADAAVATYFMLAVTYPSAAALGGGGVCLAYAAGEKPFADAYEFLPRPAAGGGVALPGNVRGMAALHARHGRLKWETLLLPAEQAARGGHPVSRALARRIDANRNGLIEEPRLAERFARLNEGDPLVQVELAVLLGQIRARGAGDFYAGEAAKLMIADLGERGLRLDPEELRAYAVARGDPVRVPAGNYVGMLAPGLPGSERFRRIWDALGNREYGRAAAEEKVRLRAEAVAAAYADLGRPLALGERGTTGFVTADKDGSAVACSLTMNGDFGARRLGRQSGVLFAQAPGADSDVGAYLAPFLLVNVNTKQSFFAGAQAGAGAGLPALATVAVDVIQGEVPLDRAVADPRAIAVGPVALGEPGLPPGAAQRLSDGRQFNELPSLGRVNAFYCYDGLRRNPTTCRFVVDPRGFGLVADRKL